MRIHFFRQWACRHRPPRRRRRTTSLFFPMPTGTGFSGRSSRCARTGTHPVPCPAGARQLRRADCRVCSSPELEKNLEVQVAGQALVANNLGARLDAVRGDALYATVLFLFLGVPGVALAAAMTIA